MKLSELSAKPQLIKISIDDEDTINEYGEAIDFWTWDRQPLDIFMTLAGANQSDIPGMFEILRKLILDDNAKELVTEENMLPTKILMKVINKITEQLGK